MHDLNYFREHLPEFEKMAANRGVRIDFEGFRALDRERRERITAAERRKENWSPERGKVLVRASPWAEIFVGERSLGVTPMEAPLELIAGRHQLRFVNNETKRSIERTVDVVPGQQTLVKVDLR